MGALHLQRDQTGLDVPRLRIRTSRHPEAKYIGIRAKDYEECELPDSVKIDLNDNDKKRASEIAAYPWFKDHKRWQKEIAKMVSNGFKMEVESLIAKDISYVTAEYVPQRLQDKDWLE